MKDTFDYNSPLALLGRIADAIFLKRYMTRLLQIRNDVIKSIAESGEAEPFLARQTTEVDPAQQSSIEM
jgi:hypothetical protein